MSPERWKKIEEIFQEALDRKPSERQKFIEENCDTDAELRAEVEKLVARFESDEEFLESPVWTDSILLQKSLKQQIASSLDEEISFSSTKSGSLIGKKIGVYRLTQELGKGGMGMVYLAERTDGEFHQKVAVKLIKRGMDTDFIIKRFRHERQILATLNHPNIAQLLDGGTTNDDLPYFVMEFIEGVPVNRYCEKKNSNLRQKLELFLSICSAISYAHKRKIIHRDIKPSNILVTEDNIPKLLDFGIAKILDPESAEEAITQTETQMRLMTPEYASPEQVKGEQLTPASDQYALGILLFELITGTRPYKFPSRAPHEIARVICEENPAQLSSGKFDKSISEDLSLAETKDLSKKLDQIILKTLRKNPNERYGSVSKLAEDVERFLRNEPITAENFAAYQTKIITKPNTLEAETLILNEKAKRKFFTPFKLGLAVAGLLIFGFAVFKLSSFLDLTLSYSPVAPNESWQTTFVSSMTPKRLTTSKLVKRAVISPDGQKTAYITSNNQKLNLWLQEINSEKEIQIQSDKSFHYLDLDFSSDGNFIYYLANAPNSLRSVYRISIDGEKAEKIIESVSNSFSISPDGKKIVYDQMNRETKQYQLLMSEINENGLTISTELLQSLAYPSYFLSKSAFSPDGQKIVYSTSEVEENKEIIDLYSYDFKTKSKTRITHRGFSNIPFVAWQKNGIELVICASLDASSTYQLWLVSLPSGQLSRLTNDFYNYFGASLDRNSNALVTVKKEAFSSIWVGDFDALNPNFTSKLKQITGGNNRQDGITGLSWTKDGKIVYVASADSERNIAIINSDGSNNQIITTNAATPMRPSVSADNHYLVFSDEKDGEINIWRYSLLNNEIKQISSRYAFAPSISPDNQTLYYSMYSLDGTLSLHTKPLENGEEKEFTSHLTSRSAVSPDGKLIAAFYNGKETKGGYQIAIFSKDGGEPVKIIHALEEGNPEDPQDRPLVWSADNKSLYFLRETDNISNIYRIGIDKNETPLQITNFNSGKIFDFSISADGKRIAIARGTFSSDVVIFRNS